jgi:3-oxoacyl-[acyl-carrier-protein] synthase-3
MNVTVEEWTAHLLDCVRRVQSELGLAVAAPDGPDCRFADVLDSMGLVEFLVILAEDCATTTAAIEACVGHRFGTVAELAAAMRAAGFARQIAVAAAHPRVATGPAPPSSVPCWIAAVAVQLPDTMQPAAALNAMLQRPPGWLENHAGLVGRRVWGDQDAVAAVAAAAREALATAGLLPEEIGALLVTSEAPPLLAGLAAALHHRLDLRPETVALEVGGACTGFLTSLWLGRALLARNGPVLIVAVEAASRYLYVGPGSAGEAAVLFGDAAGACVLCAQPPGSGAVRLLDVVCGADGHGGHLLQVDPVPGGTVALHFDGRALAARAVRTMAQAVRDLARQHGLALADLAAVVAHGGNGRMPALLARQLGLPPARAWSETANFGNLGSASLPVAWAAHPPPRGPVAWTAVGAGLTWAAALTGPVPDTPAP